MNFLFWTSRDKKKQPVAISQKVTRNTTSNPFNFQTEWYGLQKYVMGKKMDTEYVYGLVFKIKYGFGTGTGRIKKLVRKRNGYGMILN